MLSNIIFHLQSAKKWDAKLFWYQFLEIIPEIGFTFLTVLLPSYIVSMLRLDHIQEKLTDGLDTYVGKECNSTGVNFSGGEKQKLAIARAIYKDAPFVIMDEPTAALDPEAEAEVFEGFDKMVGNKTAIYISHRLASCKFCEDILVFDKGKVVQHGSHEKLEAEEGLYRQLWNAQARYYA